MGFKILEQQRQNKGEDWGWGGGGEDWQADIGMDNEIPCTHKEELGTSTAEKDAQPRRTSSYI